MMTRITGNCGFEPDCIQDEHHWSQIESLSASLLRHLKPFILTSDVTAMRGLCESQFAVWNLDLVF